MSKTEPTADDYVKLMERSIRKTRERQARRKPREERISDEV
jgi:hypothetical protein